MIDIEAIFLFSKVAESLNISRSAEELGIAKSIISRKLAALENKTSVKLIERSTRRMRLTDEGETFYEQIKSAIETIENADSNLQNSSETIHGNLRLSAPVEFSQYLATYVLPKFKRVYPEIVISIDANPDKKDLIKDNFDLVIQTGKVTDSNYYYRRITQTRLKLFASPKYAQKLESSVDLEKASWVTSGDNGNRYESFAIERDGKQAMLEIHHAFAHANSLTVRKNLIREESVIGFLPEFIFKEEISEGKLVRVFPNIQSAPVDIGFLFGSKALAPRRVRVFIDFTCEMFSSLDIS